MINHLTGSLRLSWIIRLLVCLFVSFYPSESLIVRLNPPIDDFVSKTLLLPIQTPRLLQDPQNIPRNDQRLFGFQKGGKVNVDLRVIRPPSSSLNFLPSDDSLVPSDLFKYGFFSDVSGSRHSKEREQNGELEEKELRDAGIAAASWLGLKAGVNCLGVALHALGGGIATSVVSHQFRLPSFIGVAAKNNPYSAEEIADVEQLELRSSEGNATRRELSSTKTNLTYLFLFSEEQWSNFLNQWSGRRVSSSTTRNGAFLQGDIFSSYIRSTMRVPIVEDRVQMSFDIDQQNSYLLVFLNPNSEMLQLRGVMEFINPGNNHLSLSETMEGPAVRLMFLLNFVTSLVLCLLLVTFWRDSKSDLHILMLLNFIVKSLYLLFDWTNVQAFATKGELEAVNWLLPRMISKIQDIVALMLFLLIGFGWKVHRQHLSMLETRALAGVCVLSFYLGIFEVSMGAFQAIRYIIHSLAYLIVIIAINFNIALLGTMLTDTGLSRTTAEMYQKQEGYSAFRVIFITFILKPTILLFYKLAVLSDTDEEDWILVVIDNLLDWAIVLSLGYAFRPARNFRLFDDLRIDEPPNEDETEPVVVSEAVSESEASPRRDPGAAPSGHT